MMWPRFSLNRVIAGLFVLGVVAVALGVEGEADAYSDVVALVRGFGYLAFVLLSAALCVSPLCRLLGARVSALRRALGLAAASGAALHAVAASSSSPLSLREQFADPHLRFGIGALAVLWMLALTSFPRLVRALRLRSWKQLHRLAYVAWCCAWLHALFSPYVWLPSLLGLAVVVLLIGLGRLWPRSDRA